ncbi:MAG: NFACT family protein [Deferrisomatales bacterium]
MDAFVLARLVRELADRWSGAWVQGAWEDTAGRCLLRLRGRGRTAYLLLSPLPQAPGLGLVDARPPCPPRPPAAAAYLRARAVGGRVESVCTLPFERVVEIALAGRVGSARIYLEALGGRARLFVTDGDGVVKAANRWDGAGGARDPAVVAGQPYRPPPPPPGTVPPDAVAPESVARWIETGEALHRRVAGLGPVLSREIAHRARTQGAWEAFRSVRDAYGTPGPLYGYGETLSAVALTGRGDTPVLHDEPLTAAGAWLEERLAANREERVARRRRKERQRAGARLERRLARIRADLDRLEDPERLRRQADALAAQLWAVPEGVATVELPDPWGEEGPFTVALDASLSRGDNLNRLYEKARRAGRSRDLLKARLERTREELAAWRAGAAEAPAIRSSAPEPDAGAGPFRRFLSSDGWPIWVGRNRVENDRLLRQARGWDLWLHVRDAGGAHVLLRRPGREARVPDRTLAEAAGLAARFSARAGEPGVDVMVVEAARVRKPKGGSPGRVTVSGERTLRVVPGAGNPRPVGGSPGGGKG